MVDDVEDRIADARNDHRGVAPDQADLRVLEERLRPGIQPRHLDDVLGLLDCRHRVGGRRGKDGGISQSHARIQHGAAHGRDEPQFRLRVEHFLWQL